MILDCADFPAFACGRNGQLGVNVIKLYHIRRLFRVWIIVAGKLENLAVTKEEF